MNKKAARRIRKPKGFVVGKKGRACEKRKKKGRRAPFSGEEWNAEREKSNHSRGKKAGSAKWGPRTPMKEIPWGARKKRKTYAAGGFERTPWGGEGSVISLYSVSEGSKSHNFGNSQYSK